MKRLVLLATVAALCSLGLATPVLAASPANDTYANRTVIGALPFSDAQDTSEATTDALDAEAALECGAPATDASVWYELTPEADGHIGIDASASDYAVGILVLTGSPGAFSIQGCAAFSLFASAETGTTLTILIFDFDGEGNGGNLDLSIAEAPPPPVLELDVAGSGSINQRTGVATIRGTITCTGAEEGKNFLEVQLTQTVGRFTIRAWAAVTSFACDGTAEAWEVDLVGENGRLGGGKATVSAYAFACNFDCATVAVERTVTLKR